jgi:hypothetical protein
VSCCRPWRWPPAAANLQQAGTDLTDKASLQRGAQLYMNYCSGCHSLKYVRYARIGEDLGLSEDDVQANLNFNGGKIGDHVISPMTAEMGVAAFGKAPPDLSVISRVRGSDWIYTYLKSFYLDESRPVGWNNTLFANASMPNPLWELQGLQQPVRQEDRERRTAGRGLHHQPGRHAGCAGIRPDRARHHRVPGIRRRAGRTQARKPGRVGDPVPGLPGVPGLAAEERVLAGRPLTRRRQVRRTG